MAVDDNRSVLERFESNDAIVSSLDRSISRLSMSLFSTSVNTLLPEQEGYGGPLTGRCVHSSPVCKDRLHRVLYAGDSSGDRSSLLSTRA